MKLKKRLMEQAFCYPQGMVGRLRSRGASVGLDPSHTMLGMARDRNRREIEAGRIELHLGNAAHLPFEDATFDVAFTINSLHLWPDPVAGLKEVGRTLRRGGRMGVAISRFSYASPDRFGEYLTHAGFEDVRVHTGDRGTCVATRA